MVRIPSIRTMDALGFCVFRIARRSATAVPCAEGAVMRRCLFSFLRSLCHLRDLV